MLVCNAQHKQVHCLVNCWYLSKDDWIASCQASEGGRPCIRYRERSQADKRVDKQSDSRSLIACRLTVGLHSPLCCAARSLPGWPRQSAHCLRCQLPGKNSAAGLGGFQSPQCGRRTAVHCWAGGDGALYCAYARIGVPEQCWCSARCKAPNPSNLLVAADLGDVQVHKKLPDPVSQHAWRCAQVAKCWEIGSWSVRLDVKSLWVKCCQENLKTSDPFLGFPQHAQRAKLAQG